MTPYVEAQRKITHSSELTQAIREAHAEVERDAGVPMRFAGVREESYVDPTSGKTYINVYAQFERADKLAAQTNPLDPTNLNDSTDAPQRVEIEHPRDARFGTGGADAEPVFEPAPAIPPTGYTTPAALPEALTPPSAIPTPNT